MKSLFAASFVLATFAATGSSYALDLSGSYEAQFSVANGTQTPVCFTLASTGPKKSFVDEGTVSAAGYQSFSGYYAVYKKSFHLTFLNGDNLFVTIDGALSKGHLINTSVTKFKASGEILNVGVLSESKSCATS